MGSSRAVPDPDPEPVPVCLRPVRVDRVEHLRAQVGRKEPAAEQGLEHPGDLAGGRDDSSPGPVEGEVELGHVHRGLALAGDDRVVRRDVAVGAVAAERSLDEIGSRQAERLEHPLPKSLAQRHARRPLDEEPHHDVVAAVVRPALAGRKLERSLEHQLQRVVARVADDDGDGEQRDGGSGEQAERLASDH